MQLLSTIIFNTPLIYLIIFLVIIVIIILFIKFYKISENKRFQLLLDSSPMAISLLANNGKVLYINNKFIELFGYALEDIPMSENWFKLAYPDNEYRNYLMNEWNKAIKIAKGKNGDLESRDVYVTTKSGKKLFVKISTSLLPGKMYVVFNDLTSIKDKETELQESEERYKKLFNEMIDPCAIHEVICDKRGKPVNYKFLAVNPAFEKALKINAKDFIGKTVLEMYPKTEKYWIERYGAVALTGKSIQFENFSQEIDAYYDVKCFSFKKGLFAISFTETTARKKSEEALRSLVTKFSAVSGIEFFSKLSEHLAKSLNVDIAFIGELSKNEKVKIITGYSKGKPLKPFEYSLKNTPCHNVIGKKTCFYPKNIQKLFPKNHLLVEMGIDSYMGTPLFDSKGNPIGIIVILHNKEIENEYLAESLFQVFAERVSAEMVRMRAEKELLKEKTFSDVVINSIPGAFYVLEDQKKLITWNKNFELLLNLRHDEISNFDFISWIENNMEGLAIDMISEEINKTNDTITTELTVNISKNNSLPLLLTSNILNFDDKSYLIGVAIDITENKKIEEKLRQSQKMEAIGTLAGGIAHDFNNALSIIHGYSSLLKQMDIIKSNEELHDNVNEIYNASLRSKELVNQILIFSRKTEYKKEIVKLSKLIEESLKMIRASIPSSIKIISEINSEKNIYADPTQIHQIIMNLSANAYYAMREKGGTLKIILNEVDIDENDLKTVEIDPGNYFKLQVSDTGPGIPEDIRDKIFEPYFTTKDTGEGTGLGLSVVHGIVKNHDGFIDYYSEPGNGVTFNIFLPISISEIKKFKKHKIELKITAKNKTILFVDDEKSILKLFKRFLSKYGFAVNTFSSGIEALEDFKKNPDLYDLVITDMTMPEINGADLSSAILEIKPDMPIILCSGYSEIMTRDKAFKTGIKDFLQKPLLENTLINSINNIFLKNKS